MKNKSRTILFVIASFFMVSLTACGGGGGGDGGGGVGGVGGAASLSGAVADRPEGGAQRPS